MRNSGDSPLAGWTVAWAFADGQTVGQLWNGTATTSGSSVTVGNVGWNGALGVGASTAFGFIGAWNGSNGVPVVTCAAG